MADRDAFRVLRRLRADSGAGARPDPHAAAPARVAARLRAHAATDRGGLSRLALRHVAARSGPEDPEPDFGSVRLGLEPVRHDEQVPRGLPAGSDLGLARPGDADPGGPCVERGAGAPGRVARVRLAARGDPESTADAAVDGNVPEANLASQAAMMAEAKNALNAWITRLEAGEIRQLSRAELKVPLPPDIENTAIRRYGDFSVMNQRFNSSKSSTSNDRLVKDPEEFYLYHTLYRKARETWTEIPF